MKNFFAQLSDLEPLARARLETIRRETGLSDAYILHALLTRAIDDASPLTLRKLFPHHLGREMPEFTMKFEPCEESAPDAVYYRSSAYDGWVRILEIT